MRSAFIEQLRSLDASSNPNIFTETISRINGFSFTNKEDLRFFFDRIPKYLEQFIPLSNSQRVVIGNMIKEKILPCLDSPRDFLELFKLYYVIGNCDNDSHLERDFRKLSLDATFARLKDVLELSEKKDFKDIENVINAIINLGINKEIISEFGCFDILQELSKKILISHAKEFTSTIDDRKAAFVNNRAAFIYKAISLGVFDDRIEEPFLTSFSRYFYKIEEQIKALDHLNEGFLLDDISSVKIKDLVIASFIDAWLFLRFKYPDVFRESFLEDLDLRRINFSETISQSQLSIRNKIAQFLGANDFLPTSTKAIIAGDYSVHLEYPMLEKAKLGLRKIDIAIIKEGKLILAIEFDGLTHYFLGDKADVAIFNSRPDQKTLNRNSTILGILQLKGISGDRFLTLSVKNLNNFIRALGRLRFNSSTEDAGLVIKSLFDREIARISTTSRSLHSFSRSPVVRSASSGRAMGAGAAAGGSDGFLLTPSALASPHYGGGAAGAGTSEREFSTTYHPKSPPIRFPSPASSMHYVGGGASGGVRVSDSLTPKSPPLPPLPPPASTASSPFRTPSTTTLSIDAKPWSPKPLTPPISAMSGGGASGVARTEELPEEQFELLRMVEEAERCKSEELLAAATGTTDVSEERKRDRESLLTYIIFYGRDLKNQNLYLQRIKNILDKYCFDNDFINFEGIFSNGQKMSAMALACKYYRESNSDLRLLNYLFKSGAKKDDLASLRDNLAFSGGVIVKKRKDGAVFSMKEMILKRVTDYDKICELFDIYYQEVRKDKEEALTLIEIILEQQSQDPSFILAIKKEGKSLFKYAMERYSHQDVELIKIIINGKANITESFDSDLGACNIFEIIEIFSEYDLFELILEKGFDVNINFSDNHLLKYCVMANSEGEVLGKNKLIIFSLIMMKYADNINDDVNIDILYPDPSTSPNPECAFIQSMLRTVRSISDKEEKKTYITSQKEIIEEKILFYKQQETALFKKITIDSIFYFIGKYFKSRNDDEKEYFLDLIIGRFKKFQLPEIRQYDSDPQNLALEMSTQEINAFADFWNDLNILRDNYELKSTTPLFQKLLFNFLFSPDSPKTKEVSELIVKKRDEALIFAKISELLTTEEPDKKIELLQEIIKYVAKLQSDGSEICFDLTKPLVAETYDKFIKCLNSIIYKFAMADETLKDIGSFYEALGIKDSSFKSFDIIVHGILRNHLSEEVYVDKDSISDGNTFISFKGNQVNQERFRCGLALKILERQLATNKKDEIDFTTDIFREIITNQIKKWCDLILPKELGFSFEVKTDEDKSIIFSLPESDEANEEKAAIFKNFRRIFFILFRKHLGDSRSIDHSSTHIKIKIGNENGIENFVDDLVNFHKKFSEVFAKLVDNGNNFTWPANSFRRTVENSVLEEMSKTVPTGLEVSQAKSISMQTATTERGK